MKSQQRLLLILAVLSSFAVSGCSNPIKNLMVKWRTPEVYVPTSQVVELRGPARLPVWFSETPGGPRKRGYVNAYDRWLLGPAPAEIMQEIQPTAPKAMQ